MIIIEKRVKTINHKTYPYPVISLEIADKLLTVQCRKNAAQGLLKLFKRTKDIVECENLTVPYLKITKLPNSDIVQFTGDDVFLESALKFLHDNHAISLETKNACKPQSNEEPMIFSQNSTRDLKT